jgi:hypothetical protein
VKTLFNKHRNKYHPPEKVEAEKKKLEIGATAHNDQPRSINIHEATANGDEKAVDQILEEDSDDLRKQYNIDEIEKAKKKEMERTDELRKLKRKSEEEFMKAYAHATEEETKRRKVVNDKIESEIKWMKSISCTIGTKRHTSSIDVYPPGSCDKALVPDGVHIDVDTIHLE